MRQRRPPSSLDLRFDGASASGLVLALTILAFLGRLYFRSRAGNSPVPAGEVVFQDTDRVEMLEPMVSHSLGLFGKPEYLIRSKAGLGPIEVKSRACGARGPYEGEVAQVVAYCLLVEDVLGEPVPHGILQFADRDVEVPFTAKRREKVLALLDETRVLDGAADVVRSHESPARCRGCGVREGCADFDGR